MIRDVVFRFLSREPQTLDQLAEETGIPRALIRSCLMGELYRERKIEHPEVGTITNWIPNVRSCIRVDGKGIYTLIDTP